MKPERLLVLFTLLVAGFAPAVSAADIGEPAPPFSVQGREGARYTNETLKGTVVVLESFGSDCPYCSNHYLSGAMPELQERYQERGVVWLVVQSTHRDHESYRTPDEAREDWERWGLKGSDYIDDHRGTLARAFRFKVTPQFAIIDAQGRLAYTGAVDDRPESSGDPRDARNYVAEALDALLEDRPVRIPRTRPYGCGIKW